MCEGSSAIYEDRLQLDSEAIPGGFVRYFADGNEEIIHVNRYVVELFECASTEEFLKLTKGSFRHFVCKDDLGSVESSMWGQVGDRGHLGHVYYRIRTRTGKLVSVVDYGRLVNESEYGRPIFEVFVARVSPESAVDWLTGLPGMVRFHTLARMGMSLLAGAGQRTVAMAFDITGMKAFNTRYGRAEGDRLLSCFADALRAEFGGEACSRFGEDHFYAFAQEDGIVQKVRGVFAGFAAADFERVPPVRAGLYLCDEQDDIVAVGFDRARSACDLDRSTLRSHLTWFTDEMRADAQLRISKPPKNPNSRSRAARLPRETPPVEFGFHRTPHRALESCPTQDSTRRWCPWHSRDCSQTTVSWSAACATTATATAT